MPNKTMIRAKFRHKINKTTNKKVYLIAIIVTTVKISISHHTVLPKTCKILTDKTILSKLQRNEIIFHIITFWYNTLGIFHRNAYPWKNIEYNKYSPGSCDYWPAQQQYTHIVTPSNESTPQHCVRYQTYCFFQPQNYVSDAMIDSIHRGFSWVQ